MVLRARSLVLPFSIRHQFISSCWGKVHYQSGWGLTYHVAGQLHKPLPLSRQEAEHTGRRCEIFAYLIRNKGPKILDGVKCVTLKEDAEVSMLKALVTELGRFWGGGHSRLRVGPKAPHPSSDPHVCGANLEVEHLQPGKNRESQDRVSPQAFLSCLITGASVFPGLICKSGGYTIVKRAKNRVGESCPYLTSQTVALGI